MCLCITAHRADFADGHVAGYAGGRLPGGRGRRELERLLSKLSSRLRATFLLFEIEGYTAEEIADLQGISVNTVRARIHRARKRILHDLRVARRRAR